MALKGVKQPKEHGKWLAKILKPYRFKKDCVPWNKGLAIGKGGPKGKKSSEWCEKISNTLKGKPSWNKGIKGSKSHSWKGGKLNLTERIRISPQYKKWRADVFRRDGWVCQTCGLRGHGKDIEAHHIKPMKKILEKIGIKGLDIDDRYLLATAIPEMFDVNNGITLCKKCHILTYNAA